MIKILMISYNIKLNYILLYNQQMITYMYDIIIQNTLQTELSYNYCKNNDILF